MKSRKTVIVLMIFFILSVCVNVLVHAMGEKSTEYADLEIIDSSELITKTGENIKTGAPLYKTLSFKDGQKVELTYIETNFDDIYVDAENNEYEFNDSGKLTGYSDKNKDRSVAARKSSYTQEKCITESEAVQLSVEYLQKYYSQDIINYDYEVTPYQSGKPYYGLWFEKRYGGVAVGEVVSVKIYVTGEMYHWAVLGLGDFDDFDESRLDGITKQTLTDYVNDYVDSAYNGKNVTHTLKEIYLRKINGEYTLFLDVSVRNEEGESRQLELYYEI